MRMELAKDLIKLADYLDKKGLVKEADIIDSIVVKIAQNDPNVEDAPEVPEGYLLGFLRSEDGDVLKEDLVIKLQDDIHQDRISDDEGVDVLKMLGKGKEVLKMLVVDLGLDLVDELKKAEGIDKLLFDKYKDEIVAAYIESRKNDF